MLHQSRRALICQATSFVRSNPLYRSSYLSRLSSIPLKNQGGSTPEDLSKLYKSPEEFEEDDIATKGLDGGEYGGPGAVNVGNGRTGKSGERLRYETDAYGEPMETTESVGQAARVAAVGAVETGLKLGRMAKQTADGLWEAAEKTAENARDSIVEDNEDGGRRRGRTFNGLDNSGGQPFDGLDNSGGRPSHDMIEERSPDEFVKDLRQRGGGYDLKDRW